MSKTVSIWLAGSEPLASFFAEQLKQSLPGAHVLCAELHVPPPPDALAVVLVRLDQAAQLIPWLNLPASVLAISFWRGWAYLGPFRRRDAKGCLACLFARVAGSQYGPDVDAEGNLLPHERIGSPLPSPFIQVTLGQLVARELAAYLTDQTPETTRGAFVFDDVRGEIAFEPLIPNSLCVVCGPPPIRGIPVWDPQGTVPTPALRRGRGLRAVDVKELTPTLTAHYLSARLGMVKDVQHDLQSAYGTCYLDLPLGSRRPEACIGRATSYETAQTIALLESLERYCGWNAGGRREIVTAAYAEVAAQALDPTTLGAHEAPCYDIPGFPFVRFHPEQRIDWMWGRSLRSGTPLLVPARYAAYGYPAQRSPAFFYEVSNGCALGSTLEEAVMHGLLEVVERDSFLLTWYRQLTLPELSLQALPDRGVSDLLRRVEFVTASDIRVFLSTQEHGITSLFAVATGRSPDGPRTLAAASAHPDLLQALSSVLYELAGLSLRMRSILKERRADGQAMLENPDLVRKMEDHALVNCLPEARERFSFLLDQAAAPLSFAEAARGCPALPLSLDLGSTVRGLLAGVVRANLDVVVVELTMGELSRADMRCVKVIVPGLLAMTFGHRYRRTAELPRLGREHPRAKSSKSDIGLLPHPFP